METRNEASDNQLRFIGLARDIQASLRGRASRFGGLSQPDLRLSLCPSVSCLPRLTAAGHGTDCHSMTNNAYPKGSFVFSSGSTMSC